MPEVEYDIQMWDPIAHCWDVVNCETSLQDAKRSLQEYRENQPEYQFRVRRVHETS